VPRGAVAWRSARRRESPGAGRGAAAVRRLGSEERAFAETTRTHFVFGEPSECIEQLHRCAEIGIGHVACMMSFAVRDLDRIERSLALFAERVLPHFRASRGRADPGHYPFGGVDARLLQGQGCGALPSGRLPTSTDVARLAVGRSVVAHPAQVG
jgi:hypothetical protein